jgi:hypothetical protein
MRCILAAAVLAAILCTGTLAPAADHIKVDVQGKLKTGLVAIGGETTGTVITANGVTWELDFAQNADLRKLADSLNGKEVRVTGTLYVKEGVTIKRQRTIVKVESLQEAK